VADITSALRAVFDAPLLVTGTTDAAVIDAVAGTLRRRRRDDGWV
jgi:hypothetical protein